MAIRSTTGCYTCKTRRKKCDETHPKCQRCIKSGIECSGYEYVESKGGLSKRRTRPAPRPASELARSAQATKTPDSQHSSVSLEPARNLFTPHPALFPTNHDHQTTLNLDDAPAPHTEPFEFSLSPESFAPDTPQSGSNLHLYAESPLTLSRKSSYAVQPDSTCPSYSLIHHSDAPRLPNPPPHITASWLLPGAEEDPSADEVREEMNRALHMVPRMDSSVQSNLLPFALQCYTNWMTSIRLDPSRLIRQTKDALVRQISSSENARARVMLISRAMRTLQDTITPGPRGVELVLMLKAGVQERISSLKAQPRLLTQNRQSASEALENFLEILAVHNYSCSLSSLNDLMGSVAPMFRRACPEPPDTLVDLPSLMLQADVKLRHFAVVDVTLAIMTDRPMQFRYNIDFSMDLCESMSARNRGFGLEWLLGIPDQFILLLAWMNQLREDLYAGSGPVSEEIVARIERDMKNLKMYTSENESSDPVVRVWQLVVQECWRQVVYVYLYMGLCGATAEDPRVVKAHGAFLRLVGGIRPARKPDIFLIIPWGLVGMAATKQCDRDMLRERLMLQPEGRNAGACMNNALRMLEDVWERSGRENRPAVWGDLRIACLRILGM